MPRVIPETVWKKYMSTLKDIIFIIGIVISTTGWIRSETIKRTKIEIKIEELTKAVDDNTKQHEKMNDIISQQNVLNGKIIQFMELKK